MKDCRRTLLDEFVKLSKDWDNNNMLYNSLMFSKLYPGDVENSVADASLMPKQSDEKMRNDIMTSWWTPTKIFLLGNKKELMQKSRKELEEVLLERIPMGKDEEQLRESLSKIRHEKTGEKIEKDVIDAFMGFLGSVYAVGNMTSAAVTSSLWFSISRSNVVIAISPCREYPSSMNNTPPFATSRISSEYHMHHRCLIMLSSPSLPLFLHNIYGNIFVNKW